MNSLDKGQDAKDRGTVRRSYTTPQVQVYGDLRGITQMTEMGKKADGGAPMSPNMTNG